MPDPFFVEAGSAQMPGIRSVATPMATNRSDFVTEDTVHVGHRDPTLPTRESTPQSGTFHRSGLWCAKIPVELRPPILYKVVPLCHHLVVGQ